MNAHPKPRTNKEKAHKQVKNVVLSMLTVEQGFLLMEKAKLGSVRLFGEPILRDWKRWNVLTHNPSKCYRCGVEATHWQVEKHKNDVVMPYNLNLYAGDELLTWDHIIPRSLDGSDDPLNGRCACESCNNKRGNQMTLSEILWTQQQDFKIMYRVRPEDPWPLKLLLQDAMYHANHPMDKTHEKFGMNNPSFGLGKPLKRTDYESDARKDRTKGGAHNPQHKSRSHRTARGVRA